MKTITLKKGNKTAKIDLHGFSIEELAEVIRKQEETKKQNQVFKYTSILSSVFESEDKKKIIFQCQNKEKFYLNLPNYKFYDFSEKAFDKNQLMQIGQSIDNVVKKASTKWVKIFFELLNNREYKYLSDITLISKKEISIFEQISKSDFVQYLDEQQLDCIEHFLDHKEFKIKSVKDLKKHEWYIQNINKIAFNFNDFLSSLQDEYEYSFLYGYLNDFIYAFENYTYCLHANDIHLIKSLVEKFGYEKKRLIDYICRDLPNQGIDVRFNHEDNFYDESSTYGGILLDYAKMNFKMNKDFEKYPRYLKTYHDITSKNYKLYTDEKTKRKFAQAVKTLAVYSYKNDHYSVISPKSIDDLVKEGSILNHCVASYADDVADKNTVIMFIRKNTEIDKPLVTIEINKNRIVQSRGKNNSYPNSEEIKFLDEYKKHLKKIT